MKTRTIAILGLQQIGASIGLALKNSSLDAKLLGYDRDTKATSLAKKRGTVDKVHRNLPSLARESDIIVITLPFREVREALFAIGQDLQPHALVIDLSPLKQPGLGWAKEAFAQGNYVGAVPVFNADALRDSQAGPDAAAADLFNDSVFCVMPDASAAPEAVETTVKFGALLGATPYFLDPAEYDAHVQGIETMPGLVGAAIFRSVTQSPAWRDILRFANLPFAQATYGMRREGDLAELAFADQQASLRWLDGIIDQLREMRRWISNGDKQTLAALMEELNIQRDEWLHARQENNWNEIAAPDIERPTLTQQFFGSAIGGRGRNRDD